MLVIRMEYLLARPQSYRFLNDDVFDPLECLLLGKGKAWRQVILVGTQHIFPQLIPQGLSLIHICPNSRAMVLMAGQQRPSLSARSLRYI